MISNPMSRQSGSVAVTLLILLAFVSVVLGAASLYLHSWFERAPAEKKNDAAHTALDAALHELMMQLAADPTPESDAPTDPVWSWIASTANPHVALFDASSKINPNWIRRGVFEKTALFTLFSPDATVIEPPAQYLLQHREDHGFFVDIEKGYGSLFSKDTIDTYLTQWSYANVNTSDEFSLRMLYETRTGDAAAAEVFHTRIQQLLVEKKTVDESELRSFLGQDYEKLFPVVNALPWWNVHFLPPLILEQILGYPDYHIQDNGEKTAHILSIREAREIAPEELRRIVGLPPDHVAYQYLGTRTWFWRAVIASDSRKLDAVFCRLPGDYATGEISSATDARFRIVYRRYDP